MVWAKKAAKKAPGEFHKQSCWFLGGQIELCGPFLRPFCQVQIEFHGETTNMIISSTKKGDI